MKEVKLKDYDQINQTMEFVFNNGTDMFVFDASRHSLEDVMEHIERKRIADLPMPGHLQEAMKVIHKQGGVAWADKQVNALIEL